MKTLNLSIILVTILITAFAVVWYASTIQIAVGSAPSGLASTIATTSTYLVGTSTAQKIFPSGTLCTSRVISTQGQPIMMSFASTTFLPTATLGIQQLASTTVVYDSGQYGCGEVWIRGEAFSVSNASTTITVAEFR